MELEQARLANFAFCKIQTAFDAGPAMPVGQAPPNPFAAAAAVGGGAVGGGVPAQEEGKPVINEGAYASAFVK